MLNHTRSMIHATPFGVISPENNAIHPEMHGRRRAHGTGLQCDNQSAALKPGFAYSARCAPHCKKFGMGSGIMGGLHLISSHRKNASGLIKHDGANRHFSTLCCDFCLHQSDAHALTGSKTTRIFP